MFGKSKKQKIELVKRKEIADMLKQFSSGESYEKVSSKADIDFIKSVLLPVKAKLIKGKQDFETRDHMNLKQFQTSDVTSCMRGIQRNDLEWAYNWLQNFFDYDFAGDNCCCNYNELYTGILLINKLLELCDSKLLEMEKAEVYPHGYGSYLLDKAEKGSITPQSLFGEWENWHKQHSYFSPQDYFHLSDGEAAFFSESILSIFYVIIYCRKHQENIRSYTENERNENQRYQEDLNCEPKVS